MSHRKHKKTHRKKHKITKSIFLFSAIGAGAVTVTVLLLYSVSAVKEDAISIDPIKEGQTNTARVMIANIGKLPLTSIVINYGIGKVDKLASLSPGENAMLSPPSNDNSAVKSVTVTADHGIIVTKGYRTPIKIPGLGFFFNLAMEIRHSSILQKTVSAISSGI